MYWNAVQFGHPLSTGYHYWVPELTTIDTTFSLSHVQGNLAAIWDELSLQSVFKAAHLSGSGTYVVVPYLLLAALGVRWRWPNSAQLCLLAGPLCFTAATLTYFFHADVRLSFPLILLLAASAACAVEQAWTRLRSRQQLARSTLTLGLFVLALAGFPGGVQFPLHRFCSVSLDAIRWPVRDYGAPNYTAVQEFIRTRAGEPALVLSDINPAYMSSILPAGFRAVPLDDSHHYSMSRQWRYGRVEAAECVATALRDRLPVFVLQPRGADVHRSIERLPEIPGWQWRAIPSFGASGRCPMAIGVGLGALAHGCEKRTIRP